MMMTKKDLKLKLKISELKTFIKKSKQFVDRSLDYSIKNLFLSDLLSLNVEFIQTVNFMFLMSKKKT
ncbi:CLUMA_CG017761, isoform A [Clunio marinus]|uniref:CLUMA_CG017761, isoform A n=1 Tax=Clunio marinus TaxID=568069 RepID=A0A1J1J1G3_9DIPT|nr:CLUMA_CG017761, isoform A [Clunio marinus]